MSEYPEISDQSTVEDANAIIKKMLEHIIRHGDESIRRASTILLLAHGGALAIFLSAAPAIYGGETIPQTAVIQAAVFVFGIIASGYGPVVDGLIFASLKGIRRHDEAFHKTVEQVAKRVSKGAGDQDVNWAKVDIEALFPADEFSKPKAARFLSLFFGTAAFVIGVLWVFVVALK